MSHSTTEEDQRTIKRCYYNLKKDQLNQKNLTSLPKNIYPLKQPLNQIFQHRFINSEESQVLQKLQNQYVNFQTPSESQMPLKLNELTTKFKQNKNQNDQDLSKCCTRLFTFMESTQKEKLIDQNKQNKRIENYPNVNKDFKLSFKSNNNDLPLKIYPKTQRSTKFLKQINHCFKKQQKKEIFPKKNKKNQIIDFIEGSRKKREELLIQLEKLDLGHLESLCEDNIRYLTPKERSLKKYLPKVRAESSRNSLQGELSQGNFFRRHSITNSAKSPQVVMKESLRERHFSELPLKNPMIHLHHCPSNINPSFKSKARNTNDIFKRESILKKLNGSGSKKHVLSMIRQDSKDGKNQSKKLIQKLKNFDPKQKASRKSLSRKDKAGINSFEDEDKQKKMEQLMKRKKQLEKQLLNLNDDIVLFNKKKKKSSKVVK